jgi:hypothetical protein
MTRKPVLYLGLIVLGLALVLTALMLIGPTSMTVTDNAGSEMIKAKPGETVEFVGQVTEITGNILTVEVLHSPDGKAFNQRTGQFIYAVVESTPEYVMGSEMDILVGALCQFHGTKINDRQITVERIVILTSYVEGPSQ